MENVHTCTCEEIFAKDFPLSNLSRTHILFLAPSPSMEKDLYTSVGSSLQRHECGERVRENLPPKCAEFQEIFLQLSPPVPLSLSSSLEPIPSILQTYTHTDAGTYDVHFNFQSPLQAWTPL